MYDLTICVDITGGGEMVSDRLRHQRPVVCGPPGQHEDGHRHADANRCRGPGDVLRQPQVVQTYRGR